MQTATGKPGRVLAFRIKSGMDMLKGIEAACRENGIRNGVIVGGIGSLNGARFLDPVEDGSKAGYGYGDPIVLEGGIELLSTGGTVCQGDSGEAMLHVHCTFSDGNGTAYGGHLDYGNIVLVTVDVVIMELDGIHMGRKLDEEVGVVVFDPRQNP